MLTHCAVLGSPVVHSLSPLLHRAAYGALGLEHWTYEAVEVDEAALPGFVEGLDDSWRGLSLTMPLKRAVLPLLDRIGPVAARAGAVNTVLLGPEGRVGDNTDVPGAVAAIRERTDATVRTAVVIGGGATAASLLLALSQLGCERATLLVRDPTRAAGVLEVIGRAGVHLDTGPLSGAPVDVDIVVSTIPASAQTDELVSRVASVPVVFEALYHPWPTPLAASTMASGRVLIGGLDLLVHQAVLQVEAMTGCTHDEAAALVPRLRGVGETALPGRWAP